MLPAGTGSEKVADIVENVLADATREHEEGERQHVAAVEAAAATRLSRLLSASPAVIYSFKARDDFTATFVGDNITRLFGYTASEYLDNPNFWRERVHPDDLPQIEAVGNLFRTGNHALEYRFRRKDGSYCWVNDEQHLVRDEKGEPLEVVGSHANATGHNEQREQQQNERQILENEDL
jgi:adenylate cyclase